MSRKAPVAKNIIAVTGATGAQGDGLVRSILADPNSAFAVRAITRDTGSQKARSPAAAGGEIVETLIWFRKGIQWNRNDSLAITSAGGTRHHRHCCACKDARKA